MTFRGRLLEYAEDGILIAVKWGVACAIWLGTGWVFWNQVAAVRAQAQKGDQAFTYLTSGQAGQEKFRLLDAAVASRAPAAAPSPVVEASPAGRIGR